MHIIVLLLLLSMAFLPISWSWPPYVYIYDFLSSNQQNWLSTIPGPQYNKFVVTSSNTFKQSSNRKLPVIITPEFSIQNGCEVCRTELSSLSNMQIIEFQIWSSCESIPAKLQLKSVRRHTKEVTYNLKMIHSFTQTLHRSEWNSSYALAMLPSDRQTTIPKLRAMHSLKFRWALKYVIFHS